MVYCENCGTSTDNPKFCSRSCATQHRNRESQTPNECKGCGKPTSYSKRKFCSECLDYWKGEMLNKTLEDCIRPNNNDPFLLVKRHARRYYHSQQVRSSCCRCGYDKHVEVLYITHPREMDLTTPISEVNSLENLFALCPNCKWEYDHNPVNKRVN